MIVNKNNNNERTPLMVDDSSNNVTTAMQQQQQQQQQPIKHHRRLSSWNKELFLLLTEPESSLGAYIFYFLLMVAIFVVNFVMILQSMDTFEFTPTDCHSCGGSTTYMFEDDEFVVEKSNHGQECVCPPTPLPITNQIIDYLMYFFTVEFIIRILVFVPSSSASEKTNESSTTFSWSNSTCYNYLSQWIGYLTSTSTIIDALGIFPYYLESLPNSFVSLRLLRLFRILQLVRLGKYNEMFISFTNVMSKSIQYLKLLLLILTFGAAFFGSMVYWLEKGTWKYHNESECYRFLRVGIDGITEEPTPFNSIPSAFWWFMVTATTVGYGDYYPTSTGGKWCATFAMLMGVLVIAFPVSVFSELWSNELKKMKGFKALNDDDDNDNDSDDGGNNKIDNTKNKNKENAVKNGGIKRQSVLPLPQYHNTRTATTTTTTSPEMSYNHFNSNTSSNMSLVHGLTTTTMTTSSSASNDVVIMSREDMNDIVECLYNIRENERQLKNILRKYHPEVIHNY